MKVPWMRRLEGREFDFAFLGASRVYTMVQTPLLEERWKRKGINLALDGSNLMEQYLILDAFYRSGNQTKDLFIDIDVIKLDYTMDSDFRVWCFLPYISDDTVYRELSEHFGSSRAFRWRHIPFFRYAEFNSKLGVLTAANAVLRIVKAPFNESGDWTGRYTAALPDSDRRPMEPYGSSVHPVQARYMEKIFALARSHGTRLHVYTAPFYVERYVACTNTQEVLDSVVLPLVRKHQGDYTSFCELDMSRNPDFFSDPLHLNIRGMPVFMEAFMTSYSPGLTNALNLR